MRAPSWVLLLLGCTSTGSLQSVATPLPSHEEPNPRCELSASAVTAKCKSVVKSSEASDESTEHAFSELAYKDTYFKRVGLFTRQGQCGSPQCPVKQALDVAIDARQGYLYAGNTTSSWIVGRIHLVNRAQKADSRYRLHTGAVQGVTLDTVFLLVARLIGPTTPPKEGKPPVKDPVVAEFMIFGFTAKSEVTPAKAYLVYSANSPVNYCLKPHSPPPTTEDASFHSCENIGATMQLAASINRGKSIADQASLFQVSREANALPALDPGVSPPSFVTLLGVQVDGRQAYEIKSFTEIDPYWFTCGMGCCTGGT
jgi:hypothetical protein